MCRAAHHSGCARCGAGAGYSAIRYPSLSNGKPDCVQLLEDGPLLVALAHLALAPYLCPTKSGPLIVRFKEGSHVQTKLMSKFISLRILVY